MKIGKVSSQLLREMVFEPANNAADSSRRPEVVVRPSIGEDCAAVRFNELCVLSTDPITGATEDIGYLAVHINANDVASAGGEAVGIMVTVLLPPSAVEDDLKKIMDGVYRAAGEIGIEVLGGHTEVTDAVTRSVVSATIVGKARRFVSTSGARIGQDLVMTKWAGLEGTAIAAAERPEKVRALDETVFSDAIAMSGFLSVIKEARIAAGFGASAMHDITEGGVLGACYEMAHASGVGAEIYLDRVDVKEATRKICDLFGLNPYCLISSGCLLIATDNGEELVKLLKKDDIHAGIIGKITAEKMVFIRNNQEFPLEEPMPDEIYKIF